MSHATARIAARRATRLRRRPSHPARIHLRLTRVDAMAVRLALVGCMADAQLPSEERLVDPAKAARIRQHVIDQMYPGRR